MRKFVNLLDIHIAQLSQQLRVLPMITAADTVIQRPRREAVCSSNSFVSVQHSTSAGTSTKSQSSKKASTKCTSLKKQKFSDPAEGGAVLAEQYGPQTRATDEVLDFVMPAGISGLFEL